jgi:hypothetical protein
VGLGLGLLEEAEKEQKRQEEEKRRKDAQNVAILKTVLDVGAHIVKKKFG